MDSRIKTIKHNEKGVLFIDLSNSKTGADFNFLKEASNKLKDKPATSEIRMLFDFSRAEFTPESQKKLREFFSALSRHEKKVAMFGLSELQQELIKAVYRQTHFINTEEQGFNWLTQDVQN